MDDIPTQSNRPTVEESPPLTVRLFGAIEVLINGNPLPHTRSRKELHLLALLTLSGGSEVERASLAYSLWPFPQHAHDQALHNLRRSLAELKRALGPEATRITAPAPRTLRFDLTGAVVDVVRFDALARRLTAAPPTTAWTLCGELVDLYCGELLATCEDDWAAAQRERRRAAFQSAVSTFVGRALADGDAEGAVVLLRRAVTAEPLWEAGHRLFIEALAASDQHAEVERVYRKFEKDLRRRLGVEPAPETVALMQRVCGSSCRPRRPADRSPKSASTTPVTPVTPLSPPSLVTATPLTQLIGREDDIASVAAQLRQARLVTLTGAGGVGKTRLALAVASAVTDRFADGICFVELGALSETTRVPHVLAQALGVREKPGSAILSSVAEALRARSLLIVLDNCEHLRDAAARAAATILAIAPRVRVLATSRQPLGLIGEVTWRVPSLPCPPLDTMESGNALAESVGKYPAVQLFVERAAARRPGFSLNDRNATAIATICRDLDGIPLALELAAARIAVLSAEQLAERLHERLHLLTEGDVAALPRHQTLHALVDWSYRLLREEDRRLLTHLSIFQGGWTLEALEGLLATDPENLQSGGVLVTGLNRLVDQSLILTDEDPTGGTIRFRMLETIRQFAATRLTESGEKEAWEKRHSEWFTAFAEAAAPRLHGRSCDEWMRRLAADRENLRTALHWSRSQCAIGNDPTTAHQLLVLTTALWRFWMVRGEFTEGHEWLEVALKASEKTTAQNPGLLVVATAAAGLFADFAQNLEVSRIRIAEALERAESITDARVRGLTALFAGYVRRHTDFRGAISLLKQAESDAVNAKDAWLVGESLSTRGYLELYHGAPEESRRCFADALPHARRSGDPDLTAQVVYHLGLAACQDGAPTARLYLEEGLALHRTHSQWWYLASAQCFLGWIACLEGKDAEAKERLEECMDLTLRIGSRRTMAPLLEAAALLAERASDNERAAELLGAAMAQRDAVDATLLPLWREEVAALGGRLQNTLGAGNYEFYIRRGEAMTFEQAALRAFPK